MSFLIFAAVVSDRFPDFTVGRTRQRGISYSRLSQQDLEEKSLEEVLLPRSGIPTTCGPCRKSKSICFGFGPTCHRCQSLDLECGPRVKPVGDVAEANLQDIALDSELEQLEKMMSELELDGWHIVTREEIEEISVSNSGSK